MVYGRTANGLFMEFISQLITGEHHPDDGGF
jgi:hypothetical protein